MDSAASSPTPSGAARLVRALRLLRAPVLGLLLGLVVVRLVDRARIAALPPAARGTYAHAHCERADEIGQEATRRLGLAGPIQLPPEVMGEMIAEYSRALEIDPGHLEALHARAYWRWYRDDLRGALADYERLLELDPGNHEAWYQRGRIHCQGGEHERAIADYGRAVELQPSPHLNYRSARADCRRETGDVRGALEDYLAESRQDHRAIADCRQALGEHAAALAAYDAALHAGDDPEVRYRRGLSRFALGDRAGAVEDFRRACARDGFNPAQDAARAQIAAHPGEPLSQALEEALALDPERE